MRLSKALLVFLALLLLTGCFRVDADVTIDDDGSGSYELLSAIDVDAVVSAFGDIEPGDGIEIDAGFAAFGGREETCNGFVQELEAVNSQPDAQVVPYDEDGFCGARVLGDFPVGTNHDAAASDLFDSPTLLHKAGDNWIFDSEFDVSNIAGDAAAASELATDEILRSATFTLSVSLPGEPVEGANNATSIDGNTFVWNVNLADPPARFIAQTEPKGTNWGLIGIVIAAVLAFVVLGAFILSKRKVGQAKSAAAEPGMATQPPATDDSGPPLVTPASQPAAQAAPGPAPDPRATIVQPLPETPGVADTAINEPAISGAEQPASADQVSTATEPTTTAAAQGAVPDPVFDPTLGAWVIDDPARGRLQHDPETNAWRRIE